MKTRTTPFSQKRAKLNRLLEVHSFAEHQGLLQGTRTHVVRGRMPAALVASAKSRTGIRSDTKLLEVALANLAVGDDYAQWLFSRRGTIPKDVDLEF
jgi:hypothetical protein